MSSGHKYKVFLLPAYGSEIMHIPNIHKIKCIPTKMFLKKKIPANQLKLGSGLP